MVVQYDNNMAGAFNNALDLELGKVQVVTLWDKEARKDNIYKVAYSIFSCSRFDSLLLAVMRDWLEIFMAELRQDFFLNGLRQVENFQLLMKACRFPALSKTSCAKTWMSKFVADQLAILLMLRQQVMMRERKGSNPVLLGITLNQGQN